MPTISIVTFLVLLSLCEMKLFASGDSEFSRLKNIRPLVIRPTTKQPAGLNQRTGFVTNEIDFFVSKFKDRDFKKIEGVARDFWSSPLLQAMAAATEVDYNGSADRDDDWIFRREENYDPIFFSGYDKKLYAPLGLVFLSASGFSKLKSSEELAPATGRDLIAGKPAADFCESQPGSEVPSDFSIKFSPWDLGSSLVGTSRLEASLLDLVQHPDAFDFDYMAADEQEDTDSQSDESMGDEFEHGDFTGWDGALKRFDARIKSGTLTITELSAQTRNDQSIELQTRRLLLAIAVSAQHFKKSCERESGVWKELRWTNDHSLEFFSCRERSGKQLGAVFTVEDGDLYGGNAVYSMVAGAFKFEAQIAGDNNGLSVHYLNDGLPLGTQYWFSSDGKVRATQDHSSPLGVRVIYGDNGSVEWISHQESLNGYRNLSWYPEGAVRSFEIIAQGGSISAFAGFHPNGVPKYWLPVRNGKKDGTLIWWFSSGKLAGELELVSNRRFGRGSLYYENGVEGFSASYADDAPHGRMMWRDPNNQVLFSLPFTGGKPHGDLEIRHGGRILAEAKFDGGTVHGAVILRNRNNTVIAEIPYKSGLLDGVVTLRDGTGAVRVKSEWLDGQLNGVTEARYVSGKQAASCSFNKGHLDEWSSRRPDGGFRYQAKVVSWQYGKAVINYFGNQDKPILKCLTSEWLISDCEAVSSVKGKMAPQLKELLSKVSGGGTLTFKPEKCGGAIRTFDVSPFTDLPRGKVELTYRVKELCSSKKYATGLHCVLDLENGKWTIVSCVYSDDDLVEED